MLGKMYPLLHERKSNQSVAPYPIDIPFYIRVTTTNILQRLYLHAACHALSECALVMESI